MNTMRKRKRVLGVDLGLKRTGLAVCDEFGLSTRALENLIPTSRAADIDHLLQICIELDIGVVVFGLPLRTENDEKSMLAKRFTAFAERFLQKSIDAGLVLSVEMIDESLSSKNAAKRLADSAVGMKKRRRLIDGEAARILVEEYLLANKDSL